MSLFNQILDAVNSPEREASSNQLGSILDTVQQLGGNYNTNSSNIQSAMSIVGNFTRSALKQKRDRNGMGEVNQIVNRYGGNQANSQVLSMLFGTPQLQQMTQQISSRTGLDARTIQMLLPILVPMVLNLLKTGNSKSAARGMSNAVTQNNSVVDRFLDADGDGDVDVADAMMMSSRFLGR
ncbi:DUF937 domain-containing protein [Myxosarcina sp. GI1]|uniref:DUF937 domain-containing protein n=1 Tax=Myxosarcina sp. GI1 TaxID=1541065 RepID=UPI0005686ECC|nr:DUF937 domain-containing protein [Myxosarcina sp. GI1]